MKRGSFVFCALRTAVHRALCRQQCWEDEIPWCKVFLLVDLLEMSGGTSRSKNRSNGKVGITGRRSFQDELTYRI
jgi:hypothetical protein